MAVATDANPLPKSLILLMVGPGGLEPPTKRL
jgi:hypothetical protein